MEYRVYFSTKVLNNFFVRIERKENFNKYFFLIRINRCEQIKFELTNLLKIFVKKKNL